MEITTLKTEAKLIERKSICKLGDGGETSLISMVRKNTLKESYL